MDTADIVASQPPTMKPKIKMRFPPVKHTILTEQIYRNQTWLELRKSILSILHNPTDNQFSSMDLNRMVYTICTSRLSLVLLQDVTELIEGYLRQLVEWLQQTPDEAFVARLGSMYIRFKCSADIFSSIFLHLDRVQAKEKPISVQSLHHFNVHVLLHSSIVPRLELSLRNISHAHDPKLLSTLIRGMYDLNRETVRYNLYLFSLYIPGLQPSKGYELDVMESREIIMRLQMEGYNTIPPRACKRKYTHGGVIDKYIGDCIMALFNLPSDLPHHEDAACRAATECSQQLKKLNKR
ncbi:adenylate/guanylate cyclase [Planoprotostelium fungivorum]|uniref:Adenylate/guanylate cyclase n=1 Tax=Planoprotostelium fungivorum TaxID=1890364 RepID=A0A2P6MUV8_9EUKA|nr:adenylate/guanylate cyclase [Planoprotostelium fungivorum]